MTPFAENPFAALTLIVAPAVLSNACSVLSLGTGNRFARVVDRSRVLTKEMDALPPSDPGFEKRMVQLERLQRRARLLIGALTLFYSALGAFVAAGLVSLVGAVLAEGTHAALFRTAAGIGLGIGVLAVVGVAAGCAMLVMETRLAVKSLYEEADLLHDRWVHRTDGPNAG
jgi:hypothetical protein